MSAQFCTCETGFQNLGVESCPAILKAIKKHHIVPLTDSEGNRNGILLSDLESGLDGAFWSGKVFNSDKSKRFYPTPNVYENVEPSRTDTTTEDFPSGRTQRIQSGVQQFSGVILEVTSTFASRMLSYGCSDFGVYEIDEAGNLRGELSSDGSILYPIKINKGSLDVFDVPVVEGSSVQRIQVMFQYDTTVNEANLRMISSNDTGVDLLKIEGIINTALSDTGNSSPASLELNLNVKDTGYFTANGIPVQGVTDLNKWYGYDPFDFTPADITAVTELSKGVYKIDMNAFGGNDIVISQVVDSTVIAPENQQTESGELTISLV